MNPWVSSGAAAGSSSADPSDGSMALSSRTFFFFSSAPRGPASFNESVSLMVAGLSKSAGALRSCRSPSCWARAKLPQKITQSSRPVGRCLRQGALCWIELIGGTL